MKHDVLVYDGTGRHQAVSCALHLAEQGTRCSSSRSTTYVGAEMEYPSRTIYRKRFAENGVRVTTDHRAGARAARAAIGWSPTFRHELTGASWS